MEIVFSDGSWKDMEKNFGHGWYSILEAFDGLMGVRNTRNSISPYHTSLKHSYGNGMYDESKTISRDVCVKILVWLAEF